MSAIRARAALIRLTLGDPADWHGGNALVEAARMIDRMLELGDPEGRQVWRRIKAAI
jgi:hypothetical protein